MASRHMFVVTNIVISVQMALNPRPGVLNMKLNISDGSAAQFLPAYSFLPAFRPRISSTNIMKNTIQLLWKEPVSRRVFRYLRKLYTIRISRISATRLCYFGLFQIRMTFPCLLNIMGLIGRGLQSGWALSLTSMYVPRPFVTFNAV
jgi:hypothetical protein